MDYFPFYAFLSSWEIQKKTMPLSQVSFNKGILQKISGQLALEFLPVEPGEGEVCFAQSPEVRDDFKTYFTAKNLMDYIYAVLQTPDYRSRSQPSLKTDFPPLAYPDDTVVFWKMTHLGAELREIHCLNESRLRKSMPVFPIVGKNKIARGIASDSPRFEMTHPGDQTGKVWINEHQYFDRVPFIAWQFSVGGDYPAQSWLSKRRGQRLSTKEVLHYQKIIAALTETERLVPKINPKKSR